MRGVTGMERSSEMKYLSILMFRSIFVSFFLIITPLVLI